MWAGKTWCATNISVSFSMPSPSHMQKPLELAVLHKGAWSELFTIIPQLCDLSLHYSQPLHMDGVEQHCARRPMLKLQNCFQQFVQLRCLAKL